MSTTDTRAAFEAWVKREYPNFLLDYAPLMGFYKGDDGERIGDMYDAWQAATEAAKAKQSTPTAPTLAQQIEESNYKRAFMEWSEKTDWVQEQISTFPINAIGKHRADIMREEIERLRAEAAKATGTAGELPLPEGMVAYERSAHCLTFTEDDLKSYGQACAQAAWLAGGQHQHEVEKAARQPAPVVAVKTWQESAAAHLSELREVINSAPFTDVRASYMATEIAELRAALAATNRSQP